MCGGGGGDYILSQKMCVACMFYVDCELEGWKWNGGRNSRIEIFW